ncbi:MAG: DUF3127 domain-containing protein [Bacteroidales bacterium]|nr:DUF3127 domain-containing protein [Bacteroidales bacterium]
MEITGRIIRLLPLQSGEGRNGTWKKQEFIIETAAQIPRKICFSLWGDKIDQFKLAEGENAEVSFDLESREYNNRWYTEAKAWKIVKKDTGQAIPSEQEPPPGDFEMPSGDEMPF